jgi:electron transfer flavoprotein beta subunit
VTCADLGLGTEEIGETGSRTEVYAVGEPPPRGESRRIEDNGDAAEAILEYLAEKKLI